MRASRVVIVPLLMLLLQGFALAQTTERTIDGAASKAEFSLSHIFVSRVTGSLPIEGGAVTLASGSTIPVSVRATLDATKISTGDRDQSACIQGPDYFDAVRFPTVMFASTKIVQIGPSAFGMDGTLTMHGVSRPEHLDVTITGDAEHPSYHATGQIDRHLFGMHGSRLDPVIGGIVDVTLNIVLE